MGLKSKHNKNPQQHKTKEELLADLKANGDFIMKMKFTKEQFYPALCEASTSIEDAGQLLSGFNTTIMQEFLGLMREKKISDLNLEEKLDKDSPKFEKNKELLGLFADMSVFDAKDYIEGMRNEIALFQQEEMRERPLSSLQTKWMDEL